MRTLKTAATTAALALAGIMLAACSSSTPAASSSSSSATPSSSATASSSVAASLEVTSSPSSEVTGSVSVEGASSNATSSPPPNSAVTSAAELKTAKTSLGTVVVTAKGMTAYYFDKDVKGSGKSTCSGKCAVAWPPITTTSAKPAVEGVTGTVGTITLADGKKQITIDGRPIYLFDKDTAPGDVKGQDVGGVWYVIAPDGSEIYD